MKPQGSFYPPNAIWWSEDVTKLGLWCAEIPNTKNIEQVMMKVIRPWWHTVSLTTAHAYISTHRTRRPSTSCQVHLANYAVTREETHRHVGSTRCARGDPDISGHRVWYAHWPWGWLLWCHSGCSEDPKGISFRGFGDIWDVHGCQPFGGEGSYSICSLLVVDVDQWNRLLCSLLLQVWACCAFCKSLHQVWSMYGPLTASNTH